MATVKKVIYQRVFSMPNYENKKVGIEIELNENDHIDLAMEMAINFVEKQHPDKIMEKEYEQKASEYKKSITEAKEILASPEIHTIEYITEAALFLKKAYNDDLPF
jgi:hypothetical protein